jgi:hypothetical protein
LIFTHKGAPEGRLFNPHGCEALRAEQACVLLIRTIVEGAKRPRQRQSSPAAMERSGMAVRCSALFGADLFYLA